MENGRSVYEIDKILDRWEKDYRDLYTCSGSHQFNDAFLAEICKLKNVIEVGSVMLATPHFSSVLNIDISLEEVQKVIDRTKPYKAVGVDELSNEVLKCPKLLNTLHVLFQYCFKNGTVPSVWYRSIIKPIPKTTQADPRVPLNYRGISLLNTACKVFSGILNNRLSEYIETNRILVDEQNGFRKHRTCIDHIYVLSSVIRARLQENQSTFVCFVDFKKAFDWVNRDLLKYKLLSIGITGHLYNSIRALYKAPVACVQINDMRTGWFPTPD